MMKITISISNKVTGTTMPFRQTYFLLSLSSIEGHAKFHLKSRFSLALGYKPLKFYPWTTLVKNRAIVTLSPSVVLWSLIMEFLVSIFGEEKRLTYEIRI